jgi:hypothetical protein
MGYTDCMSPNAQSGAIFLSILGTYIWLSVPSLDYYSPQLAGVLVLIYFGMRFFRKKHLFPLSNQKSTPEFALVSTAILLLIGSTGNLDSFFFPLSYLHIFFLVMSVSALQAIGLSIAVIMFHYGLIEKLSWNAGSELMSILLLLFIFLFAKKLYEDNLKKQSVVEEQENFISTEQTNAILFITTFLKPKLENLLHLSDYPEANKDVIQRQIIIVQDSVEELLQTQNNTTK